MLKDINLIPDSILYRHRRRLRAILILVIIGLAGSGLITAALYPTFERIGLEREIEHLSQKIDRLALGELEKAQNEAAMKQRELDRMKAALENVESKRLQTVKLITHFNGQLPQGINADLISIIAANRTAVFEMTAIDRKDIVLLLERLNDDPWYSSVNISPITGLGQPFAFTLTLEIAQDVDGFDR